MAYLTQLQSSALSNQNITSALLLATYTNTTRLRKIFVDVFADQIAGNGNYTVYSTRQRAGSGSAYEVGARTTVAVPSGVTAQAFPTIALMCGATDVIKVYLVGLAGDTTTPDTVVEFSEEFLNTDSSGNPTSNDSSGITTLLTRVVGTLASGTHNAQSGDAYARLGAPAGASIAADIATVASYIDTEIATLTTNVSTVLSRLGAFTGSGINTVLGFLRAMARKDAALTPSDMAGTFDNTTDSLEAIKDAGASATISDSDMTTIAGRVWNNTYAATRTLTQSAASVTAAVTGSDIAILRGDTVTIALTGLGSLTGRSALYFTVKDNLSGADSAALLQVSEGGGLLYLNGAVAGTSSDASLTVTDASAGNISIVLKPAATKLLDAADGLRYDVQMVTGAGVVTTLTEGDASVSADVTRAVA